jgi:glycosyltransferase involved in cell wall biosynthesis
MFSVLMSCYKNDDPFEFLAAVNSMFDQSYRPAEFILVCDGPLNIELESQILIAIEISNKKGITFVVHRLPSNVGLGQALLLGLSRCTQEFIVRMDSDDLSRSNRLMLMKNEIIRNKQLDVIGAQIEEFEQMAA